MLVLLIGHRRGISKALEARGIDYILWSNKKIKNKLKALSVIVSNFPGNKEEVLEYDRSLKGITHVIAGVESAVVPASQIRLIYKLKRNPHGNILKCTNKYLMKSFLSKHNIPMTKYLALKKIEESKEVIKSLGTPFVCKPRNSSGGRGISFIDNLDKISQDELKDIYFEKAINGTEGSVESLIKDGQIVFTNITEYQKSGFSNIVPASYSDDIKAKVLELNQRVLKALNLKWGLTHLEYYLTEDSILFGEVALRPPGGYIMEALSIAYDENFWDLYLCVELDLKLNLPLALKCYTSSLVFHPGAGRVSRIDGIEQINRLESVEKFKLKLEIGQEIKFREGVGEDFGYALLKNKSQSDLLSDISRLDKFLVIDM